ncbi:hypothetical protein chiPu_0031747, partial [Chiloscyllium punctatum]|nr:hypothetical protein [Chiloscyllium punctatum]
AAGDDGDLQEGEDQPDRRLSSRRLADPGVLLALQGAVHHHRDAARAVLRLDQGPLGAGSDQPVHAVRPDPVRSDRAARTAFRLVPGDGHLADHHGHHDVGADEAQSGAAGSDPEDHLRLDAADLHLHAGRLPGGSRDLLGLEQHALGAAAELHHAQERREGGVVRQSEIDVRQEADIASRPPRLINASCPALCRASTYWRVARR